MGWRDYLCFGGNSHRASELRPKVEPTLHVPEMPKVRKPKPRNASHFREVATESAENYLYAHGIMEEIYKSSKEGKIDTVLLMKDFPGAELEAVRKACQILGFTETSVGQGTVETAKWLAIAW